MKTIDELKKAGFKIRKSVTTIIRLFRKGQLWTDTIYWDKLKKEVSVIVRRYKSGKVVFLDENLNEKGGRE